MINTSKVLLLLAYIAVLSWITILAFNTSSLKNSLLIANYFFIALSMFTLSKINNVVARFEQR